MNTSLSRVPVASAPAGHANHASHASHTGYGTPVPDGLEVAPVMWRPMRLLVRFTGTILQEHATLVPAMASRFSHYDLLPYRRLK